MAKKKKKNVFERLFDMASNKNTSRANALNTMADFLNTVVTPIGSQVRSSIENTAKEHAKSAKNNSSDRGYTYKKLGGRGGSHIGRDADERQYRYKSLYRNSWEPRENPRNKFDSRNSRKTRGGSNNGFDMSAKYKTDDKGLLSVDSKKEYGLQETKDYKKYKEKHRPRWERAVTGALMQTGAQYGDAVGRLADATNEDANMSRQMVAAMNANMAKNKKKYGLSDKEAKERMETSEYFAGVVKRSEEARKQRQEVLGKFNKAGTKNIEKAKEGLGTAGQFLIDTLAAGTQFGADTLLSGGTGALRMIAMGGRSYAGGVMEAKEEGADENKAELYGLLSAAREVGTEKIFNVGYMNKIMGNSFAGGKASASLENAAAKVANRFAKSKAGKTALYNSIISSQMMLTEGAEEFIADVVDVPMKRATYKADAEFDLNDALRSGAIGSILGGFGIGGQISQARSDSKVMQSDEDSRITRRSVKRKDNSSPQSVRSNPKGRSAVHEMINTGLKQDQNTASYRMARQIQDQIDTGQGIIPGQLSALQNHLATNQRESQERMNAARRRAIETYDKDAAEKRTRDNFRSAIANREADAQEFINTREARGGNNYVQSEEAKKNYSITPEVVAANSEAGRYIRTKDKVHASMRNAGVYDEDALNAVTNVVTGYTTDAGDLDMFSPDGSEESMAARATFTAVTGKELPDTAAGTQEVLDEHIGEQTYMNEENNYVGSKMHDMFVAVQAVADDLGDEAGHTLENLMVNNNVPLDEVEQFADAFRQNYTAGALGLSYERTMAASPYLEQYADSSMPKIAYEAGSAVHENEETVQAIKEKERQRKEKQAETKKKTAKKKRKGTFTDKTTDDTISKKQKKILKKLAEAIGVDIVLEDSLTEGGVEANGYYSGGVIHISATSQDPYITVFKHELTHHLQKTAPEEYKALRDFVVREWYNGDAEAVQAAVQAKIEAYRRKGAKLLTPDEAMDEIIADASEEFFRNDETINKVIQANRSLGEKILDWIRSIIADIKALMAEMAEGEYKGKGKFLSDLGILEEAEELWTKALGRSVESDVEVSDRTKPQFSISKDLLSNLEEIENNGVDDSGDLYIGTVSDFLFAGLGVNQKDVYMSQRKARQAMLTKDEATDEEKKNHIHGLTAQGLYDALVESERPAIAFINEPSTGHTESDNDRGDSIVLVTTQQDYKKRQVMVVEGIDSTASVGEKRIKTTKIVNAFGQRNLSKMILSAVNNGRLLYIDHKKISSIPGGDTVQLSGSRSETYYNNNIQKLWDNVNRMHGTYASSDEDINYLSAVKAGDMETAQKMVDEAAKAAGYTTVAYHGTDAETIKEFTGNPDVTETNGPSRIKGYFSDSEEYSETYGENVNRYYLNTEKFLGIDGVFTVDEMRKDLEKNGVTDVEFNDEMTDEALEEWFDSWGGELGEDVIDPWLFFNSSGGNLTERIQAAGYNGVEWTEGGMEGEVAYMPFDSQLIKSADPVTYDDKGEVIPLSERFNEKSEDIRFSLQTPVEEAGDLLAMHNLKESDLAGIIELGGMPMPSIAVTNQEHSNYGDITLLFDKNTIDPARKNNSVFGGDAWTPTFPEIQKKISVKVADRIDQRLRDILGLGRNDYTLGDLRLPSLDDDNLTNTLRYNDPYEAFKNDEVFQIAYLKNAKHFDITVPTKEGSIRGLGKQELELLDERLPEITYEDIYDTVNHTMEFEPAVRQARKDYYESKGSNTLKSLTKHLDKEMGYSEVMSRLEATIKFRKEGVPSVVDRDALEAKLNENVDQEGFKTWINNLFEGIIEKTGIRNNKDIFTPAGNRRSWESLHDPVTLENVVRSMRSELAAGGSGLFGSNPKGAAQKRYKSLDDIRADKGRLQTLSEEEYKAQSEAAVGKMSEVCTAIAEHNPGRFSSGFGAAFDVGTYVAEVLNRTRNRRTIQRILENEYNISTTEEQMDDLMDAIASIAELPTGYFEAKPQRAVGLDEVKAAIIPDTVSQEIKDSLNDWGVDYLEYKAGNEEDRQTKVNQAADEKKIRFSIKDSDGNTLSEGQQEYFRNSTARDAEGNLLVLYHGTPKKGFTVFKDWQYFSANKDYAANYADRNEDNLYKVYANVRKPFDTRIPECREIFENEYMGNYSNTPLQESGLPDWTDGYDLTEFLEENGYDYDAVLLDEGATPSENGEVQERGISYVIRNSNQVKNTDNENPTGNPDIRYSIQEGMSDQERYDELKDEKIDIVAYKPENMPESDEELDSLKTQMKKDAYPVLKRIASELGVTDFDKAYRNPDLEIEFYYSNHRLDESANKQVRIRSDSKFYLLAQLLTCFDDVINNAKLIETHQDRYEGTKRENPDFVRAYVLVSAFANDTGIVPVKLLVKENNKDKNTLHVSIALPEIKRADQHGQANQDGQQDPLSVLLDYKLSDLLRDVKRIDEDNEAGTGGTVIGKYIPNQFLNENPTENEDIRFSRNTWEEEKAIRRALTQQEKTIDKLQEKVADLRSEFRRTRVATIDEKVMTKDLKAFLKDWGSGAEISDVLESVKEIHKSLLNKESPDWDRAYAVAEDTAKDIINKVSILHDEMYNRYKELRDYLRKARLQLTEKERTEIPDYNDFRKSNMGKINLVNDGRPVDTVYAELAKTYPEFFNEDSVNTPGEMVMQMVQVIDSLQPYYETMDADAEQDAVAEVALGLIEFAYDPKLRKTFADRAAERQKAAVEKEKEKGRKRRQTDREKFKEKIAKIKADRKQAIADLKLTEKQRREKLLKQQRQKVKEVREKARQRATRRSNMNSIKRNAEYLSQALLKPTDTKHIPQQYRTAVATMLSSLDFESVHTDAWIKRYGQPSDRVRGLREMAAAYRQIIRSGEDTYLEDPYFEMLVDSLAEHAQGMRLADMDDALLADMATLVKAIRHNISNANRAFNENIKETISELGNKSIEELEQHKKAGNYGGVVGIINKLFNESNVNPGDFFETIGSDTLFSVYQEIRKGFDQHVLNMDEAKERLQSIVDKKQAAAWSEKAKTEKFDLSNGQTIEITPAQKMSLWCLMRRDQARQHILGQGIVLDSVLHKERNVIKKALFGSKTRQQDGTLISFEDVYQIISTVTDEQKKVCRGIMDLMNGTCKQWGNEASMKLYGYEKFNEENYFPIQSAQEWLDSNPTTADQIPKIKSQGMTKAINENANNPIVVGDIFNVVTKHVNDMSMYNTLAVPLTDFERIYNFKQRNENGGLTGKTTKSTLTNYAGERSVKYINQWLKDVNNYREHDQEVIGKISNQLLANYKKATIGFNLRVLVQQPTALMRSLIILDPRDVAKVITQKPAISVIKEMQEHSPLARWKSDGHFETDISRSLRDDLLGKKYLLDRVTMDPYGFADNLAWASMWKAVKNEIHRTRPELERGSEEYWQAVNERFEYVMDRTQVVDSVFHRSQVMRNQNIMLKMISSFMAEPTKTFNMLRTETIRAARQWQAGNKKEAAGIFSRVAGIFLLNAAAVSAAAAAIDLLRDAWTGDDDDDDKEQKKWDKFFKYLKNNFAGNANPLAQIVGGNTIFNAIEGFDQENLSTKAITDLAGLIDKWQKFADGDSKFSLFGMVKQTITPLGQLIGVPLKNGEREFESVYRTILGLSTGWNVADYMRAKNFNLNPQSGKSGVKAEFMKYWTRAISSGNEKEAQIIMEDMIKEGVANRDDFTKKLWTEYGSTLKDDVLKGGKKLDKTIDNLTKMGIDEGDIYEKVNDYRYEKLREDIKNKDYDSLKDTVRNMLNQGMSKEVVNEKVIGSVKSKYKEAFEAGDTDTLDQYDKMLKYAGEGDVKHYRYSYARAKGKMEAYNAWQDKGKSEAYKIAYRYLNKYPGIYDNAHTMLHGIEGSGDSTKADWRQGIYKVYTKWKWN